MQLFSVKWVSKNAFGQRNYIIETKNNKFVEELRWFVPSVIISFSIWCFLALIVNQNIILDECLYGRERDGFIMTIGFIYFMRLSAWLVKV